VGLGWVTHSTRLAYSSLPGIRSKLTKLLSSVIKAVELRRADRWIVEAENARQGLARRIGIPLNKIDVVPNTCSTRFVDASIPDAVWPRKGQLIRLLYVAAYYPHKNIEFLPSVAATLRRRMPDYRFQFVITVPASETDGLRRVEAAIDRNSVRPMFKNEGRVSIEALPALYATCDICIVPSLLETFSASYPEAMAAGRPIATSDLDFARSVCGDAALYFHPENPDSAAEAICELLSSRKLWNLCIKRGRKRLKAFPRASERYQHYVDSIARTAGDRDH